MRTSTKIWFVTDIHGSNACFRKLLNVAKSKKNPDVLIIGGDLTGKHLVPIVYRSGSWVSEFRGETRTFMSRSEVREYEDQLGDAGAYGFVCDHGTAQALTEDEEFVRSVASDLKLKRMSEWVELLDERFARSGKRIFINAGNDDPFVIDGVLDASEVIVRPEGKCLNINDDITMISTGFANITPWNCPRDVPESVLTEKIEHMAKTVTDFSKCIFNFHCPPFDTPLDQAPRLKNDLSPAASIAGIEDISVGSKAVRDSIERFQPAVSLHGHIHEQYCYTRLGRTLCFNPGTEYYEGRLRGVYLEFEGATLAYFGLTREAH